MRTLTVLTHLRKQRPHRRKGVAAAEFAVSLPILLVLMIGTIEACSMIYLKQTLSVAAYESIRASVVPNSSVASVQDAANAILTSRGVSGSTVVVSPADYATQPAGSWITVTVSAPGSANSVITGWYYDNQTVSASATMMKEF
ncbi:MAG: TadE/TadG family type IV pilus assembly protein [Planctomycetaceae bacterium]